jgi:hypothetical protein
MRMRLESFLTFMATGDIETGVFTGRGKRMNLKDLYAGILQEADIEDLDLIQVSSFMWFPMTSAAPTLFRTLHPTPMPTDNPQMVLCIFHKSSEEMHVYIVPVTAANADSKPHERIIATDKGPPLRYTLSKTAPTLTVESIALPLFREEIIKEMRLAVGLEEDDDDTITCTNPACQSEESTVHVFCSECGTRLPEVPEEPETRPILPAAPSANITIAPQQPSTTVSLAPVPPVAPPSSP